jgi:hypothetical protein
MRVIHVLRKPLSEGNVAANVLKHGCGALNIDVSRISTSESLLGGAYAEQGTDRYDGAENWRYKRKGGAGEFQQPTGRWPGNLILEHLPGCRKAGHRQVPGSVRKPTGKPIYPMSGNSMDWNPNNVLDNTVRGHADSDGMETVESWDCEPGCPISNLDAQSGVTKSAGGRAYQNTNVMYEGGWDPGRGVAVDPGFGDVGGASRFFKQVGGLKKG